MRRNKLMLNENKYSFYENLEGDNLIDKILDYYVDKLRKYGKDCLTEEETRIFNDAKRGSLDNAPKYARNKVTGDIDLDDQGNAILIEDTRKVYPGIPFLTSKGEGKTKEVIIEARCYWDVDSTGKYYYVFSPTKITEENKFGLIIYKTESKDGTKPLGTFLVPKGNMLKNPDDLWEDLDNKFDKGTKLDSEMFETFLHFNNLYHTSKKTNLEELGKIYNRLKKYPKI